MPGTSPGGVQPRSTQPAGPSAISEPRKILPGMPCPYEEGCVETLFLLPVPGASELGAGLAWIRNLFGLGSETVADTFGASTVGAGAVRVLQTGGKTLSGATAAALNKANGLDLARREWGRALELLKGHALLRNDFHGQILSNGDYVHATTGEWFGNLLSYIE